MINEISALMRKEILLEWRQRYSISGILLYLTATIFLIYISLIEMKPALWIALFWIIMLFTAVSAVARSFIQESKGRQLYYYSIVHPRNVILAKLVFNSLVMAAIGIAGLTIYSILNESPIEQTFAFVIVTILGSISFALSFTLMSAVASKANHNVTLMAILSMPFILPILLLLIKLSTYCLLNHIEEFPWRDILLLTLLDLIMIALSIILFPFLWRE